MDRRERRVKPSSLILTGIGTAAGVAVLALGTSADQEGAAPSAEPSLKDAPSTKRTAHPATAPNSRGSQTGSPLFRPAGRQPRRITQAATLGIRPNSILFQIVKEGTAAVVGGSYESDMPGFADVLSDDEIRAVLAYIRSTWPEREREYQRPRSNETGSPE